MSETAQLALIAMLGTVAIPSIMAYLKSRQNSVAIQELHVIVNDRLTQLIRSEISGALLQGAANERDRPNPRPNANTAALNANTVATEANTEESRSCP